MTDHKEILLDATRTLTERTEEYGAPSDTYARAATIASTVLQKDLTAYDIVMIMHAVKLSRMPTTRGKVDNYSDAINYLAFAAEFATKDASPIKNVVSFGVPSEDWRKATAVNLDQLAKEVAGE